jgi:hypothetical protein
MSTDDTNADEVANFKNSSRKAQYAYFLTLNDIPEKSLLTHIFNRQNSQEFENLKTTLKVLKCNSD